MKKIITTLISALMIFSVFTSNVYANEMIENADGSITQKVDTTQSQKDTILMINKKKYLFDKEQLVKEEIRENKTLTEKVTLDNLEEKKVPDTKQIDIQGEKFILKLSDVQYKEKEIENGTIDLTGTIDYGFLTERPTIAPTKEVTYTDNNKQLTTTIPYSTLDKSNEYWKSGFSITGKYIGDDDVSFYNFNGTLIPNTSNGTVPYKSYEKIILENLGINPNKAKIDNAQWTNTYQNNGQQVKECVFNLSYLGANYTANYSDNVIGHKTVYEANATYTLENANVKTGEIKEYMEVTYKPQNVNPVLVATTTACILALIIVLILFILKKKKKRDNK